MHRGTLVVRVGGVDAVGQVDGEDAALPGQVAQLDVPAVGLGRLVRDGQAEPHAAAAPLAAHGRLEPRVDLLVGDPAALVVDLKVRSASVCAARSWIRVPFSVGDSIGARTAAGEEKLGFGCFLRTTPREGCAPVNRPRA